ncbi:MAG: 2TM domain-containing protein [Methyloceanibacter sp.]|jgi:2TM domain-containing protein|nr:2TM domain-containing protein [Methyloceanibacter sp.]
MFKDLAMRVFLIHLAAFVVVTAGLAAINLWFAPQYPWFIWVLIGWGAAVATHALALLLRKTRRRERIFVDRKARSFTVHLFAYVATVLILFFVNLTVTPRMWWFYWVALGWGAGIIAHGWCAFFKRRRGSRQGSQVTQAATKSVPASKRPRRPRSKKPSTQP